MGNSPPPSRRTVFNRVAHDYDALRPGYPAALIEDIIAGSALPHDGHIVEVGCGTGQATLPFAQRGYAMACLDIGPELIAIAAEKCRRYPNVQFHNVEFESWQPHQQFDLLISATAFHWIPREIAYPKAASVLKACGSIAIFSNEHPTPFTGFAADVQIVYQQVVPEWRHPNEGLSAADDIKETATYINSTGLFEPVVVRTYPWSQRYSAEDYVKLLNTYSDHHSLEASKRSRLFDGIREFIHQNYVGSVIREYLAVLYLAQKRQA